MKYLEYDGRKYIRRSYERFNKFNKLIYKHDYDTNKIYYYEYNEQGLLIRTYDSNGNDVFYDYDEFERIIHKKSDYGESWYSYKSNDDFTETGHDFLFNNYTRHTIIKRTGNSEEIYLDGVLDEVNTYDNQGNVIYKNCQDFLETWFKYKDNELIYKKILRSKRSTVERWYIYSGEYTYILNKNGLISFIYRERKRKDGSLLERTNYDRFF